MLKIHIYLIYMNILDLELNNLQWLICYKTKANPNNLQLHGSKHSYLIQIICTQLYHHHHQDVPTAQIPLTHFNHLSLSVIALGEFFLGVIQRLHRAGEYIFLQVGHALELPRKMSLMNSFFTSPAGLVHLIWMVCVMGEFFGCHPAFAQSWWIYIYAGWSCIGVTKENVTYEFIFYFSSRSCSSYLDSLCDGK